MNRLIGKKEKGIVEIVMSLFLLTMVIIMLSFLLRMKIASVTKAKLEDGLTLATLAVALVDMDRYTKDGEIIINTEDIYDIFIDTLRTNLKLNEHNDFGKSVMYKHIDVDDFLVYNLIGDEISCNTLDNSGNLKNLGVIGKKGDIKAPNGEPILKSSIYVSIDVSLDDFLLMGGEPAHIDNIVAVSLNND